MRLRAKTAKQKERLRRHAGERGGGRTPLRHSNFGRTGSWSEGLGGSSAVQKGGGRSRAFDGGLEEGRGSVKGSLGVRANQGREGEGVDWQVSVAAETNVDGVDPRLEEVSLLSERVGLLENERRDMLARYPPNP
jgi:hypothetical protein